VAPAFAQAPTPAPVLPDTEPDQAPAPEFGPEFVPEPVLESEPEPAPEPIPEPEPAPWETVPDDAGPVWPQAEAETVFEPGPGWDPDTLDVPTEPSEPEPEPLEPEPEPEPQPEFEPAPEPELDEAFRVEAGADTWLAAPAVESDEASAADLAEVPMLSEPPGFVRQAQRRAFWRRRGVRAGLWLLSVLLLLGLALQWVLHERHRIAALRPDLKPVLDTLCQPLGCRVEPMRWIDALSIDSTTLARRGNGRYGLEVVVRNASAFELALPALELSLTDAREQLLLRRVILPADLGAPSGLVPARGQLTLRLDVGVEAPQADALAGYRTLLFYP